MRALISSCFDNVYSPTIGSYVQQLNKINYCKSKEKITNKKVTKRIIGCQ